MTVTADKIALAELAESDRKIRKSTAEYVKNRIDIGISELMRITSHDINYLSLYPLTMLEESIFENNPATISNQHMRSSISWFLRKFAFDDIPYKDLKFRGSNYRWFKKKVYPLISQVFQDYRTYLEILDHWSYASSKFEYLQDERWRLLTSLVVDKYNVEKFYYDRTFDKQLFKNESRLITKIGLSFFEKMLANSNRDFGYDEELYCNCIKRIELDLKFLGDNPQSQVIGNYIEFKKIIASLFYIAHMKLTANQIKSQIKNSIDLKELVIVITTNELREKIANYTNISEETVCKVLDYLTLTGEDKGSLFEFPLIKLKNHYVFNPSSIIVNDWHFSLVNGHYCKEILFPNREKMISSQIVEMLEKETISISNIKICKEKYYEYYDEKHNNLKSDVDFAIYDLDTNKLLVIECKWKDNHYLSEIDYNYLKIHYSLFNTYDKQITKHQGFLSKKNNVDYLFDSDAEITSIVEMPEIEYLIIDKRNQLYLEGRKMMSVYMLISLLQAFKTDNKLNLEGLITHINSLKTTTEYFTVSEEKEFKLEDGSILLSDDLELDYNFKGI